MRTRILTALLAALLAAGCGGNGEPENGVAGNGAGNGGESLPEWKGTMTLDVMTADELQALVDQQQGKVVVVQFWSTWCEPCKRMLPDLVTLQKRFGQKVTAVSVNTDYHAGREEPAESLRSEVEPILKQQDARFQNAISETPDEELFSRFGMATNGVIVYNQKGEVVERFVNPIDPEEPIGFTFERDIEPLVRKLLSQST